MARPGFQRLKEQVIIVETFFNEKSDLTEKDRRELVSLIKKTGDLKELKSRLKDWETSSGGSSFFSTFKSLFFSREQTSKTVNEAARRSKDTKDKEFLAALSGKVSREPLLEQFVQDIVAEAHEHFREFMERRIPRLYSRAHDIRQQAMYRQVELEARGQDQKRRVSSRNTWFDEIKTAQAQMNSGYVCVVCGYH